MRISTGLLAAAALTLVAPAYAQTGPVAFPGAEGAGAYALGGRGGAVIKVTNLNDAGPGSLRAAVEAKGPRTVVFEISGTIQLKSVLKISNPRITIAGQTAPGDGITLRDHPMNVAADDVVIRYIRSRLGDVAGVQDDALWVSKGRRIILDHVSASWSVDETLSVTNRYPTADAGPQEVTVQWSIIAESLNRSAHDKGAHGYGSLVRGGRGSHFSFHHNLWASHLARMPRPGNYATRAEDPEGAFMDFRNNVFYNWGGDSSGYNADTDAATSYNFINNAYVAGPNTQKSVAFKEQNPFARGWFEGNAMNGLVADDPWSLVTGFKEPQNRLPGPLPFAAVRTEPARSAYTSVMSSAGAAWKRDAVDKRILAGVRDYSHRIINSQADVGGWPELKSLSAPKDTDGDGMPDDWEKAKRLNPNSAADGAAVAGRDGYTNLEKYLNDIIIHDNGEDEFPGDRDIPPPPH